MTGSPPRNARTRRGCGSTNTTAPGSAGENHPAGSLLRGPRPATRLMTSLYKSAADRHFLVEAASGRREQGAMGTRSGRAANGVRMKRLNGVDALMLYSETPEIHMHTLKIGVLDVSGVDGFDFELFKSVAYPRLMALPPLRYQLVDIPYKLHHPMWAE